MRIKDKNGNSYTIYLQNTGSKSPQTHWSSRGQRARALCPLLFCCCYLQHGFFSSFFSEQQGSFSTFFTAFSSGQQGSFLGLQQAIWFTPLVLE